MTMEGQFTLTRTTIRKLDSTTPWPGCGETDPQALLLRLWNVPAPFRNASSVPQKWDVGLPYEFLSQGGQNRLSHSETTQLYHLPVVEAGRLRSRCAQGQFPPRMLVGNLSPALSRLPVLAATVAGPQWPSVCKILLSNLFLLAHSVLPMCLCPNVPILSIISVMILYNSHP